MSPDQRSRCGRSGPAVADVAVWSSADEPAALVRQTAMARVCRAARTAIRIQRPQPPGPAAIDNCTRLRILKVYPRSDQNTAIQFLDYVLSRLPFAIETIWTESGAEFKSAFHWHELNKGTNDAHIKPATPRLNGNIERSHRIDAEEFHRLLDGVVIDDINIFDARLKEWAGLHNYDRPDSGLNGQTAL